MAFSAIDYVVFFVYFCVVITLALWAGRTPKGAERTATDFFLAGRSLPWWVIGTSLIASNISAEQMIGMSGSAFATGIAIVSYEWMAAVTLIVIAIFFLPVFLRMQIFSMPQYLERRFDRRVSGALAVFWVLVYVFVNLTTVLYLGAIAINEILEWRLVVVMVSLIVLSTIYTSYGGLSSVAWTDFIQVIVLFCGGLLVTWLGLREAGEIAGADGSIIAGFKHLRETAPQHFHTVMPWNHPTLPWIGVFLGGMWIANFSYWGFNQYITQRALAGRNLREAQLGLAFAAFLKLIVPIIVVLPGIIAFVLYADRMPTRPDGGIIYDRAFPTVVMTLAPTGILGLVIAALVAAIVSSLNSMTNSTATIFTMDIYRNWFRPDAPDRELVLVGRIVSVVALVIALALAPGLRNFGQVFQFIQEYTGFVSPGIVAIFLFGIFWPRATSGSALAMAMVTIPANIALAAMANAPGLRDTALGQFLAPFLHRMALAFVIVVLVGFLWVMLVNRRPTPAAIAAEQAEALRQVTFRPGPAFVVSSLLVLGMVAGLYVMFW